MDIKPKVDTKYQKKNVKNNLHKIINKINKQTKQHISKQIILFFK